MSGPCCTGCLHYYPKSIKKFWPSHWPVQSLEHPIPYLISISCLCLFRSVSEIRLRRVSSSNPSQRCLVGLRSRRWRSPKYLSDPVFTELSLCTNLMGFKCIKEYRLDSSRWDVNHPTTAKAKLSWISWFTMSKAALWFIKIRKMIAERDGERAVLCVCTASYCGGL